MTSPVDLEHKLARLARNSRGGRYLRNLAGKYRITLSVIEGNVSGTQNSLTLLLSGSGPDKAYLLDLLFSNQCTEILTRTVWLWRLPHFISRYKADLLIAIDPKDGAACYLSGRDTFVIPIWVRGEIDFKTVSELYKTSKNVKRDLSRIRKNKLDYTITTDPKLFDYFYYRMHIPYIKYAYGDAAFTVNYKDMKKKISELELLLVKKGDEIISGEIILYEKGGARSWFAGVKDGNRDYVKLGALSALYYFNTLYLENKGFNRLHAGSTRAFLKDGVLQYKRKWGMRIIGARKGNFVVDVLEYSDATRSFLANNPFIQLHNNEFTGMYFLDSDESVSEARLREIHKSCYFPGMEQLNIYQLDKTHNNMEIPDDLQNMITVYPA